MADFLTGLHVWITTAPLVSPDLGTRFYPIDKVPQQAVTPYATYQVISDPRPMHLKGYDQVRAPRVQIDVYADKYATARKIGENIILTVATPGTHGGVQFGLVKGEGPRDLSAETGPGTKSRASLDLLVSHRQP